MTRRVHNFSAGPSALPLPVLEQIRDELVDFRGHGASLMEMSHRGPVYEAVQAECVADLRRLAGIPEDYAVLFMGGGARTQFALVAANLLAGGRGDYLVTGTWAEGALEEARKLGEARELWSSADTGHDRVPEPGDFTPDPGAAYLHYTSNNTIYGTQFHHVPDSAGAPLVCDMSSDILSRPVDVARYGMIYAGAQKNMGPAGVTVVVLRPDLLQRSRKELPEMWSYKKIAAQDSMLNTPPTFQIYVVGLVVKWLLGLGGLTAMGEINARKADALYSVIDGSGGFYRSHARPGSRSGMNVNFRCPTEELDLAFRKAAEREDLTGLKGHRSVGGLRASIYNAVPEASVRALTEFMVEFARTKG